MKKILLSLMSALPLFVFTQQQLDTIKLKNGKIASGYIYRMEDGKVYLARANDSATYSANEIQMLMFCNSVRGKDPCDVAKNVSEQESHSYSPPGISKQQSNSRNASTFSSFKNEYKIAEVIDKTDTEKGSVVFKCTMCGGKGSLSIQGDNEESQSSTTHSFTMKEDQHFFVFAAQLLPGEYQWKYCDTNNNNAKGKLVIKKGTMQKITLFE
ncbi:MAG: hypothetical protein ACKVOW_11150 [Chitinophagaceae bacterium]